MARIIQSYCAGLSAEVYRIENRFFGESVTVAGLVTGGDLIEQLTAHRDTLGDALLIPAAMLRAERDLFLDGVSVDDVRAALGTEVRVVESGAEGLISAMCVPAHIENPEKGGGNEQ
jgi:NifB/MoaA-like Fe-S oxidoreductase